MLHEHVPERAVCVSGFQADHRPSWNAGELQLSGPIGREIFTISHATREKSRRARPYLKSWRLFHVPQSPIVNTGERSAPRFGDWRVINAQALLVGRVTQLNDGRLKTEFRLWDVVAGTQLSGTW